MYGSVELLFLLGIPGRMFLSATAATTNSSKTLLPECICFLAGSGGPEMEEGMMVVEGLLA